jgi:hypothetical protein
MNPEKLYAIFDNVNIEIIEVFNSKKEALPIFEKYVANKVKCWMENDKNSCFYTEEELKKITGYKLLTLKEALKLFKKNIEDECCFDTII